jgi:acyl-CoA synthetase (NDP forming)
LRGKEVIFYKAGRTPEGKSATSGHTASIAGDYMVCESCVQQAGAMVAHTFTEFNGLLALAEALHEKHIGGNRLAAVSNAGFEAVGLADNVGGDDYKLELVSIAGTIRESIAKTLTQASLENLVNVKNPLDLTPMANEAIYADVTRVLLEDSSVDLIMLGITPLTPIIQSLDKGPEALDFLTSEQGIVGCLARLFTDHNKPLVVVIDSGTFFDYLAGAFQQAGVPVFRSADRAMRTLGRYVQGRLRAQRLMANSTL